MSEKKKQFKIESLKTDPKKSEEGIWYNVGGSFDVLIARIGNPKYQNYIRKTGAKRGATKLAREGAGGEEIHDIQKQAIAKHVLLDWRGLYDDAGKEIPYSQEKALEYMMDPSYNEFYQIVLVAAQDMDLFRAESITEAVGNSEGSSAGS